MKQRIRTKTNERDRKIILILPILVGILAGIVIRIFFGKYININPQDGFDLVKTVFDVWGILLGFIFTAVSILLTIGENSFINMLVETNHMQNIIFSYITSGVLLLIAIIFSLVLMFIKMWNTCILYIFIGINITIVVSISICVFFLVKIISNMGS